MDDVLFVCGFGARIGASHFSYWTEPDKLTSLCTSQSSFTEPSFTVSPAGMKSFATFTSRYHNLRIFRELNRYVVQACTPLPSLPIQLPMMLPLFVYRS